MEFTDEENEKLNYLGDLTNYPSNQAFIERLKRYQDFYTRSFRFLNNAISLEVCYNEAPHPLNFEIGHIVFFYDWHFLRRIMHRNLNNKIQYFDSLTNQPEMRATNPQLSIEEQLNYMNEVFDLIISYLDNHSLSSKEAYVLEVCLKHNEMHKEVIYFICQQMKISLPGMTPSKPTTQKIQNEWKRVQGGSFSQGLQKTDSLVVWDNESPSQNKIVKSFECQKYPVTYGEFLHFVFVQEDYWKKEFWSFKGWKWLKAREVERNNKLLPFNIFKKNGVWYRRWFDQDISLDLSLPVTHISYYEAEAYARWMNARLPTETEYEYMITNGGMTSWPWGDDPETSKYCNSNYKNTDIIPVGQYPNSKNKWGIEDLFGNNWVWTSTPFYPYDGFAIDPIYDTFSYPFFYDRIIIRGSSWCVDDTLFHSRYRNAQEPEKRFHFTGIRLVRDL
jgi:iron(II)-dependent oxidoreductase